MLGALGMNVAATGAQMGLNAITAGWNDKRQYKQQERLTGLQTAADKQMSDYNIQKQIELWNATGYKAQMEQLKQAGLNPAMMYGKGGAGGTTVSANTVARQSPGAPNAPLQSPQVESMGMQLALLKAQKENIEADTRLKQAGATKTEGVDTQETVAKIKLLETLESNEAVKTEINEQIKEQQFVETHIKTMTMNMVVAQATYQTQQAWEVLQGQITQNKISQQSADDQIAIIKQTKINLIFQKHVMEAGIAVDMANINKISQEIAMGWEKLSQSEKIMKVEALIKQVEQNYKGKADWIIRPHDSKKTAEQIDKIMNIGKKDY